MTYRIVFDKRVIDEDLPDIPMLYKEQIKRVIKERLSKEPIKLGKPLKYSLNGLRRLKVGDLRIIYRINDDTVEIIKIRSV